MDAIFSFIHLTFLSFYRNVYAFAYLQNTPLQKCLQYLKALCREIVVAVAGETEVDQFPELFALAVGHEHGGKFPEGRAEIRSAGLDVSIEVADVVLLHWGCP